ncbi:hypothetical protein BSNK01_29180 [Bacillaceae bacterium]
MRVFVLNNDFIKVKQLEGELKLSQVKPGLGCTITTKEIVFQKPHRSYHFLLEDIIRIIPLEIGTSSYTFRTAGEKVTASFGSSYYKITVEKAKIYNRSGIHERGEMEFIVPLTDKFLKYVSQYSSLVVID